jgi:hypothetical protein
MRQSQIGLQNIGGPFAVLVPLDCSGQARTLATSKLFVDAMAKVTSRPMAENERR